jgi:hypothetical protein
MIPKNTANRSHKPQPVTFLAFGVIVRIESNADALLDEAMAVARDSLLGKLEPVKAKKADVAFRLAQHGPQSYSIGLNGEPIAGARSRRKFLKFFDALLRATIGEYAPDLTFLHAGVVGWKGKAIVMPADSFKGKSTITAELVRRGAAYYSDDFAILDKQGRVRAFPRTISLRDENFRTFVLAPESLGATKETPPIPVGLVLFTEYKPKARWKPRISTAGKGVLEMVPYALSFRRNPEFCLSVLNSVAASAIIASSPRGTAEEFARLILDFVDKNVN